MFDQGRYDSDMADREIEELIDSIRYDIQPSVNLRPSIIEQLKSYVSDRMAERKLSGFAITLVLLIAIHPQIWNMAANWRNLVSLGQSKEVETLAIQFARQGPDAASWSIHDSFQAWRKNQFTRLVNRIE